MNLFVSDRRCALLGASRARKANLGGHAKASTVVAWHHPATFHPRSNPTPNGFRLITIPAAPLPSCCPNSFLDHRPPDVWRRYVA